MIAAIVFGALLILGGLLAIFKQWLWSNQGFAKRTVTDERAYTRYMGLVDLGLGLVFCVFGIVSFWISLKFNIIFIFLFVGVLFFMYGERKFRIPPQK